MTPFEIVLLVCGAVLSLTSVSVVYRMIVGPTILDRAISSDVMVVMVVMAMALYTAYTREIWAGPAMLALTGLAFIGTVTFARFVAREVAQNYRGARRHEQEPGTGSGPLEAVHLYHRDGGPRNRVSTVGEDPGGSSSVGADGGNGADGGSGPVEPTGRGEEAQR